MHSLGKFYLVKLSLNLMYFIEYRGFGMHYSLLMFFRNFRMFSSRLIHSSQSMELKHCEIEKLWPIWINEYTKLKAWTDKDAYQRRFALGKKYVFPVIGSIKPNQVTIQNVVSCLELVLMSTKQSHWKVLVALSQFLRWCATQDLLDPTKRLPTDIELIEPYFGVRLRSQGGHHPAVDWREVPRFISLLVQEKTIGAKALLFVILTTSRLQSVSQAQWKEINLFLKEWQIPASHMKGKQGNNRPHEVPLSSQAMALLQSIRNSHLKGEDLIFSATGSELSGSSLRKAIRKIDQKSIGLGIPGFRDSSQNNRVAVTHGFRASFATWAQEIGADMSVVEFCLAHCDSNDRHNGAYRRGSMINQRRLLLQAWADFCFSYKEPD